MKITFSREAKIGIVITLGVALLYWGINFLKGKSLFSHKRVFYAVYSQVNGLLDANPVYISGVKIGQVEKISFVNDGSGNVLVKLIVFDKVDIPINSVAKLYSSDIIGGKAIEIKLGNSSTLLRNNDTLKSEIQASLQEEINVQILPVKKKAEELMMSFDSVLAVVQAIFNEETRTNISKSFESIKHTIMAIEHTSYNIDTLVTYQRGRIINIFANVESISANIRSNNQKLTNIISNFSSISDTLARADVIKTINETNASLLELNTVLGKINKGEGSMGMLVNDDSLYNHLSSASNNLSALLEDMRLHPKRYVHFSLFGKKDKTTKKKK